MKENINYRLLLAGLPEIKSLDELSDKTHLSKGLIYKFWKFNKHFYKKFYIPKRDGSKREINSPTEKLKAIQGWILKNILNRVFISENAKAYVKGIGLVDNALPHSKNKYILRVDIKDFFTSIKYNKVFTVFKSIGYSDHISHILTSICTYENYLPQGAVTSPALSNIVCIKLDRRLSGLAGKKNIIYTRYADDLIFSGMNPNFLVGMVDKIKHILNSEGFVLNDKKTKFMGPAKARFVTGLTISEHGVGISCEQKRKLRSAIYNLSRSTEVGGKGEAYVRGWFNFLKSVDRKRFSQLELYQKMISILGKQKDF